MSLNDRLATYFRERPYQWVNAHELLTVAGFAAWRTRLSELRRAPFNMTIQNRQRRVFMTSLQAQRTISEYRYVPWPTPDRGTEQDVTGDSDKSAQAPEPV